MVIFLESSDQDSIKGSPMKHTSRMVVPTSIPTKVSILDNIFTKFNFVKNSYFDCFVCKFDSIYNLPSTSDTVLYGTELLSLQRSCICCPCF